MKLLLSFILVTTFTQLSFGQYSKGVLEDILATYPNDKLLLESSRLMEEGYYATAEKLVDKLLASNPENSNYNYRKGFILSEAHGAFAGSIPYLEKAVKQISKNYDMYSPNEEGASVDALFLLGRSYHRTGQLDRAESNYKAFLDQTTKKTEMTEVAQLGLDQLAVAKKSLEFPKRNVSIINLGEIINTPNPEYSPVVSLDGSSLYFTSRRQWSMEQSEDYKDPRIDLYPEDIYVTYKDFDETWVTPARLEFCEADHNEASISVSQDERRIYVYQDTVGNGDIFYSDFSTNRFNKIKPIVINGVNSKDYWETHCAVTPDGRTMYFTSARPGGFGGRDIYRVVKTPDGNWGQPFNLGPTINSAFDEESPFIASDNKTLYFASNGPKSMGGFDIFVSVIDEDNNWSDPINLGSPVNSTGDDLFYTETIDGRKGYITSTRSDTRGEKDIYEVQNDYMNVNRGAVMKGKMITLDNRPIPEDVTISLLCSNCDNAVERTVYPRARDGQFMMLLEPCRDYEVIFRHSDGTKEFYREQLKTDCSKDKEEIYREVYLDAEKMAIVPPPVTDTVPSDTLSTPTDTLTPSFTPLAYKYHFGYNKNKLNASGSDYRHFLRDVEAQLKNGRKQIVIYIYSSASNVPTRKFKDNQELSETRAANMRENLETHFAKEGLGKRVEVKVVSAVVSGPAYNADAVDKEKYTPFQFVELKTN